MSFIRENLLDLTHFKYKLMESIIFRYDIGIYKK